MDEMMVPPDLVGFNDRVVVVAHWRERPTDFDSKNPVKWKPATSATRLRQEEASCWLCRSLPIAGTCRWSHYGL